MDPEVLNFAEVATIIVGLRDRIEGLQQSVDTIAIEVERIAEAQRFSAKLLSERAEQQPLPR